MKRKFTFLITAMALMIAIIGSGTEAWGQETFQLVTSVDEITTTGEYLIVSKSKTKATNATIASNALQTETVTESNNVISTLVNADGKPYTFTLESAGTSRTTALYYIKINGKYLNNSSSTKLSFAETASSKWKFTKEDSNTFLIQNTSNSNRFVGETSSGSGAYKAYATSNVDDYNHVYIYKKASTSPSCTIDPTSYDFGDITVGQSSSHNFTATTANLTGDLTVTASDGFTVTPATIASTATSTTLSVTCTPTAVGDMNGTLTISGGGLAADVTATLSATGLCVAPATALAYTTPVVLTLTGTDVSTTLTPTENTGNGGTITYALVEGDENHIIIDGNEVLIDAIGSYTVRATQALNGTTCGGTSDIVINVTGTSPTCTIDPTEWDFGNVGVGASANKTFTVTTANLTENLSLSMLYGTNFSVSPTAIEQGATATEITVTCTPTAAGELEDSLTISGGGLANDVDVQLNATGFLQYTVTYSAVNGTVPDPQTVAQGSAVTLGTVTDVDCSVWSFVGWSETESSTTEPTLLAGGEYTPTGNVTLYAVYRRTVAGEDVQVPFVIADIADANNWKNATVYSPVTISPITMTASSGSGKYYSSDDTWRFYNGGSLTITSVAGNITTVSSEPNTTFTITDDGAASQSFSATTKFESITVTYKSTSYAYSTNPSCLELVATPTFSPNNTAMLYEDTEITISCTTDDATIYHRASTDDEWIEGSTVTVSSASPKIYAKATKEGMAESEIAIITYSFPREFANIAAFKDAYSSESSEVAKITGSVTFVYRDDNYIYIQDNTGGLQVYDETPVVTTSYSNGDVITGICGTCAIYGGMKRFIPVRDFGTATSGTEVAPIEVTAASYLANYNNYESKLIKFVDVDFTNTYTFSEDNKSTKFTQTIENETSGAVTVYNQFGNLTKTVNSGDAYNVIGFGGKYGDTKQVYPRTNDDIELIVFAPTFDPEGGDYNAAQTVTISTVTPSAAIYYTLDGTAPTSESTSYTEAIEIGETTTLKAIAIKEDVSSSITEATYTITITTVATPTIAPESGTYFDETLEVTLDCATDGATIVYTTDDWTTSTTYDNPFTITETATVKAKATKSGMDDSEIATATFTKKYKINYSVNGDETAIASQYVIPEEAIGTLPSATAPNGYTFRGWSSADVTLTDVEPTYVQTTDVPTADMNLKAVFAIASTGDPVETEFSFNTDNFTEISTSYTTEYTHEFPEATVKAYGVYKNAGIQMNKGKGTYIKNTTAMPGYITKIVLTWKASGNNSVTMYAKANGVASTSSDNLGQQPNDVTTQTINIENASSKAYKYFYLDGTTVTGACVLTKFSVYYMKSSTVYSNFCTSVTAISGNLAEATTVANTAYYISAASTVPENATATINGVLGNADASLLIINDGAQLILNNSGVKATVKKDIAAWTTEPVGNWYLISSPVGTVETEDVTNLESEPVEGNLTYDLYRYNEPAKAWFNAQGETNPFSSLNNGEGYLYARKDAASLEFKGTIATESVNVPLSYTSDNGNLAGFNLLGNPFMQNIKNSDVTAEGSILAEGYYILNLDGTWSTKITNGSIAPMQGFLVQANDSGTATISKPGTSKDERSSEKANIEIVVSNSNYSDNAYAMYGNGIGLNKINHRNAEAPMVYVPMDNEKYAVACIDESVTLFPVCFKAATTGYYTISLKSSQIYEGYNDFDYLHLIDNTTGEEIDMLLEDDYRFIGTPNDNPNRFTVKLHRNGVNENEVEDESFVYQNDNTLVVNGEGTLQVIDMLGRIRISKEVHGETVSIDGLMTGAYIVRMIGNEIKTQKVIIR